MVPTILLLSRTRAVIVNAIESDSKHATAMSKTEYYRGIESLQRVGIKGHAVAEAVAEAPKGVARALLYIVRASPSFLLHPSFKTFYHTFYHNHYLLNHHVHCDGVKAEPKNRQICLVRRDNNQADALQRMRDEWKKVESCRRAVRGLVVTPSVS